MATDKKKRWLITGGTGFYGTAMAWYLIRKGIRPVLYDIAPLDDPGLKGKADVIRGDVRHKANVDAVMKKVGVVINAAAALPLAPPREIWTTAVDGSRIVFESAHRHGIKKSLHISTTAVYGVPKVHPLHETSLLTPIGAYGAAKCEAEQVCFARWRAGQDLSILRPKSFIGTGRLGVFQILFDWVESGVRIPVLGPGTNLYQLLEVQDLCDATYKALTSKLRGDVYNVGATRYGSVAQDVGALCEHAGTGAKVWPIPSGPAKWTLRALEAVNLSPLYAWIYETCDQDSFVSVEKIQKALGWKPKWSNAQTLCNTYDWYLDKGKPMAMRTGTTHRVAWKQGALGLAKAGLKLIR